MIFPTSSVIIIVGTKALVSIVNSFVVVSLTSFPDASLWDTSTS